MNRIVREHYPVADLPENLREGLEPGTRVRVTVEPDNMRGDKETSKQPFSLDELFAKAKPSFASFEEVSAHIRTMRDDWIDRG